tara:strand:- start:2542 stop:2994 length:453 start_codon:yes stop_codon:yes gene_type:complete
MFEWIGVIGNLLGIGRDALDNKAKLKKLRVEQEHAIVTAQTNALVDRIKSNTDSDNEIDLITARDKRFSHKDEIVTYTFLMPVFIATATPFIKAWNSKDLAQLEDSIKMSYQNLNELPDWYMFVLFAIIIDVLGFRSFARKVVDKYINKK